MFLLPLNDSNAPRNGWLFQGNDILKVTCIGRELLNGCTKIQSGKKIEDLFSIIHTFNAAILNQFNIPVVQHYIRFAGQGCYDLLTVIPKQEFFSADRNNGVTNLSCEFKSKGRVFGFQIGFITIPWTETIELLKLKADGFILIYNNIKPAA